MKYYTGIGYTEDCISKSGKDICSAIARVMKGRGYTLITGDCTGADQAFREGAGDDFRIWASDKRDVPGETLLLDRIQMSLATNNLSRVIGKDRVLAFSEEELRFACRNFYQVYNDGVLPDLLFYYGVDKLDGTVYGNTTIAVETARYYNVPCVNINKDY